VKRKQPTKHRGAILQAVVDKSNLSVVAAAERAGYSRSSYYYHIMDPELSFEILQRYGRALNYDFKNDFPEMSKHILEEDDAKYIKPTNLEQAVKEIEKWREKYFELLERYRQLLEEKLKK
jgi:hypothetical protein